MKCTGLYAGYEANMVLENVSFELSEKDYLLVVGENGAGKSTLIKCVLNLLGQKSGSIEYIGIKPSEIGYLPQRLNVQRDFPASVSEVVLSGCINSMGMLPFYNKAQREKANAAMKRLMIYDIRKKCFNSLSGGQQQKVLLARALCSAKKLLLLDEPVAGLDPQAVSEFYELVTLLNREQGVSVIMVTHDVSCAINDANLVLHLGDTALFCTAEEYRRTPQGKAFLDCHCPRHGGDA